MKNKVNKEMASNSQRNAKKCVRGLVTCFQRFDNVHGLL